MSLSRIVITCLAHNDSGALLLETGPLSVTEGCCEGSFSSMRKGVAVLVNCLIQICYGSFGGEKSWLAVASLILKRADHCYLGQLVNLSSNSLPFRAILCILVSIGTFLLVSIWNIYIGGFGTLYLDYL